MAHRHKMHEKKARGGGTEHGGVAPKKDNDKPEYNAVGSHVMKEAHEMKRGGKAHGHKGKHRLDKKARGGSVKADKVGKGKDMTTSPFSAAHVSPAHSDGGNPHPHHLKHKGPHRAHPK